MNFAIIDDESTFTSIIEEKIIKVCKSQEVAHTIQIYNKADTVFCSRSFRNFDVILIDIEMPGISGIDAAKAISDNKISCERPYIIFVTAKDNLVFDALKTYPYSFIRKSHLDELDDCIAKLCKKLSDVPSTPVKTGRNIRYVEIRNIIRLEKSGNYIVYHTTDETLQTRGAMDEKFTELLPFGFVRPGVGSIVNAAFIIDLKPKSLRLSDGSEIFISRAYAKQLKRDFNEWMVRTKC